MSFSVEVASLLTMLFLQAVVVNGDCENITEDEHYGTNLWYEIKPDKQSASDTNFECRKFGGSVINTTNTELLSYIVNAHGSSEDSFWIDQYSTNAGSFPPSCRYYDSTTGLIVVGSWECYSPRHTICTYPGDGCIPIPPGTEHCPYGFVEEVDRNLCFAAILSRSSSDPCGDFGVTSVPLVYDSGDSDHIDLLKDVVDMFNYPDLMYNIRKEGGNCHVFHRDTEMITEAPCSELENRVLCQHNLTYNGPCPVGGVYGGSYPPGKCYVITEENSKDDLFEACPTRSNALRTTNVTLLKWIAASSNLEGESFFIAPLVIFSALYNGSSDEIVYDLSNYQTLHSFICEQRAEASPFASSENETSGFSTTSPVQTTLFTQQGPPGLSSSTMMKQSESSTSTTQLQSESQTTLSSSYTSRAPMGTSTSTMYYYQSSTDSKTSQALGSSKEMGKISTGSTSPSSESSSAELGTTSNNGWTTKGWIPQTKISSTTISGGTTEGSIPQTNISFSTTTVNPQSNVIVTDNSSIGYNQTGFTTTELSSTEACNGHCELTLEDRLANATLDDVRDIVENEDLGSEDILKIQEWFEDNVHIREDEENYLLYTRAYLHTFNKILTSTKEDTFYLANPAVFAESCNELLEDFAGKWSFNVTLEILFSNIETELVRKSADTFEGFTSDFNSEQNEEQLDGYISIENDWVEDYNTTENSTIDIIVVMYQASMVDSLGNDETNEIVSNFVSITVVVDGETISLPVTFGLELDEEKLKTDKKGIQVNLEPLCVFWDYSLRNVSAGYWSTYGCVVISQNVTYVRCSCNHTTNFAILMQTTEVEISSEDEAALSLLSLIGLGISTTALLITIIVLVCLPSLKSDRVFIHKHLVVALIIAQTLFISTLGAVHQEIICKLVAIFLHYFYLAVFMWMLIEGVHLYLEIVQVFSRFDGKNKTVHYIVTGWGLPLIVVGVSVAIRWKNYGVGKGCWLSIADGLIWAFLGPVAFVILINFIILLMVIRVVFRASSARGKDDGEYKHLVAALKGALFLLPLLGLTWAVGFMSVNEGTLVFQYLFVILNSLQGLFIFLFYCAMNKEVRTALSRRFSQVALESGGSKSLSLRAVAKLKSSGKSTSPVLRFTDSSGASVLPSKSSGLHSEVDGKRESISASGISVHQKEPDPQPVHTKVEPSQSPFSPNYD